MSITAKPLEPNEFFFTTDMTLRFTSPISQMQQRIAHPAATELSHLFDSQVPITLLDDLKHSLVHGHPWIFNLPIQLKSGIEWHQIKAAPILENGQVTGAHFLTHALNSKEVAAAQAQLDKIKKGQTLRFATPLDWSHKLCLMHKVHPLNLMVMSIMALSTLLLLQSFALISPPNALIIIMTLMTLLFAIGGRHYVFKRQTMALNQIRRIQEQDFTGNIDDYGHHSLSELMASIKSMQVQLGAKVSDSKLQLHRSMRLKSALDSASTKVMLIGSQGGILYCNDELKAFLQQQHQRLQQHYPKFQCDTVIGQRLLEVLPIETFHNLEQARQVEQEVAGLTILFAIKPVLDHNGTRIGTGIEWNDLTQERKIEANLKQTLAMASIGHTALTIETGELEGFYRDTSENINALLSEINKIIESMVFVMTRLASGDLKGRIDKNLQGALAAMKWSTNVSLDNLSAIVLYIKKAAESVSQSANESAQVAHDLSDRTQQAAATLEEINSTMQLVHDQQKENTQELNTINQLSRQTTQINSNASESLDATIEAIEAIQQTSEQISNIIGLIDGIAFQTNLLALNAAVEAARAGEHGRGFAVVAGEVRSLAAKSAEAAKDIKGLIDDSVLKVSEGVVRVRETSSAFHQVNESISQISGSLGRISSSIQEQQLSVGQVAQSIDALDQNIQSNAALVEQTSASAEALRAQADLLHSETDKFQLDEIKAHGLIQTQPTVDGIRMSDVRQKMRIWQANAQSYLNGIDIPMDLNAMVNPQSCGVGLALSTILSNHPELQSSTIYKGLDHLHQQQHYIVAQVIKLQGSDNLEQLEYKDQLLNDFVEVTDQLDKALLEFDIYVQQQSYAEPLTLAASY